MVNIAQRIEDLRKAKNITRPELAAALGLPKTSIEKFETGRLTPNKDQQTKLANYFGVTLPYLRGEIDDPGTMSDWLSGSLSEEGPAPYTSAPTPSVSKQKQSSVASSGSESGSNIFQSESFKAVIRQTVLEVLRSPEGQKILSDMVRKELNGKR